MNIKSNLFGVILGSILFLGSISFSNTSYAQQPADKQVSYVYVNTPVFGFGGGGYGGYWGRPVRPVYYNYYPSYYYAPRPYYYNPGFLQFGFRIF